MQQALSIEGGDRLKPRVLGPGRPAVLASAISQLFLVAGVVTILALPEIAQAADAAPGTPASFAARKTYNIPAGSLEAALNRFGREAGILLSFPTELTNGLKTKGLQGSYNVQEALPLLLYGTDLVASIDGASAVIRRQSAAVSEATLPAVHVTAVATATTEGSQSYSSSVVTLNRGEQKLKDIPQSVSVLTRQRMDDQALTTLADAVGNTTGLVATQGVGPGTVIMSRGFQIDSYQYDGVPLPRNTYSIGNWSSESLAFYDRVEVLRGAAGLTQGTNSPGGAINFVRKRGQAKPMVTVTGKAGSWDHYGLQLDAGGPLNAEGTLRGRVVVDEDRSDSFINYVWANTRTLYAALDYDISPNTTVGIGISNKETRSRPSFIGLPRYADKSDIGLPRSTYTGSNWNRAYNDQSSVYADLDHRFNDNWSFKASAVAMREKNTSVHQRISAAGTGITPGGNTVRYGDFAMNLEGEQYGLDAYVRGRFEAMAMKHEVIFGANYSRYHTDDAVARRWTTGGNIFAINNNRPWQDFASIAATPGSTGTVSSYDVEQTGVYGTWRAQLTDRLTAILGGRVGWFEQMYSQPARGTDPRYESVQEASGRFTPYGGLVYALSDQWSAYTSYSDVFEVQSAPTLSGAPIKPVTGTNYEFGIKGELADGRVNTSFAVFRYDHKNRAVVDPDGLGMCNGNDCSRAAGKVRSQGFEAEVSGEVLRGLQLFGGYTFNTTKYLIDPVNEGKVFSTWTPKHMLRLWADYKLPGNLSKFSVGGGVNTQSKALSFDSSFDVPGFTIWSARAAYQVTPELSLALNVNNLFDKTYYLPSYNSTTGNNYYGTPRSALLTLKYTPRF
ncbi:TonB-dependent siderophore receptor [Herminiimonas glaciei]|uniref:TonB-dependent siderophore receptor n=1 Tax=Herminiimonas glaciei TaxID=523788 RepID=A0ABW2IDQ9_9BURK